MNDHEMNHTVLNGTATDGFAPPRHWVSADELTSTYWNDPQVQEKRGQEFIDKPVEGIALIDKVDTQGLARREFLTLMGASMALTSISCARRPVHKIIPYVVAPEEVTPGVANYYASTDPETGYGLLVKTREGRPIKLEGNPDHPINRGAISARAQASILDLYDPERSQEPMMIGRADGSSRVTTWSDADQKITAHLKAASASGKKIAVLTGSVTGDSTRALIHEFLAAHRSGDHVEFDVLALDEINQAQELCYGQAVLPTYRFGDAMAVVNFGADFLGTWLSSSEHSRDWAKNRKLNSGRTAQSTLSKLITFETMMTLTGANSDERYPVRPGDELMIALGVAHVLASHGGAYAGDSAITHALALYSPEAVAQMIGLKGGAKVIREAADLLSKNKGKGLAVGGNPQSRDGNQVALQVVINLINSLCDNDGHTVVGNGSVDQRPAAGFSRLQKLIAEMNQGAVGALIIHRVNAAYSLPAQAGFVEATRKVPLVISISDRVDETAMISDYLLPDHHPLENWGDAMIRAGVYSLQQPTLAPLYSTRAFQDDLLVWMGKGTVTFHDYVMNHWKEKIFTAKSGMSFTAFWEKSLRDGVYLSPVAHAPSSPRKFKSTALSVLPKPSQSPVLSLVLYPMIGAHDGRQANNAWLQEFPDPVTRVTWDNFLAVGPGLAASLGVKKDDIVEVTVGGASFELPVLEQPGLHDSVAAAAIGYGRKHVGKVGNGVGVDLYPFIGVKGAHLVFSGQAITIRKTGKVYRLANTQYHHVTEGRPIINDLTFTEWKKTPGASNETDPELRTETTSIWPTHEYKGYRWGMSIDLNSCTGCGACVIGCQSENNIPVVGRDNVRKGRAMHWIRLDRYFSGPAENPDVVFQAMLCQHCENAPCETVCPVLATVHDDEGLNNQIYNRCVGTRYCQNNCPYKVRRFNFFDHWKQYEANMNLVWNPDVTVRTRGIMEKCTFCVQRIEKVRSTNKLKGEHIKDGDIKTACQQACPTDAIVFGNINDPNSRVSQLKRDARDFRALEVLNVKPVVSYLTKVRNKEAVHPAEAGGENHG